LQASGHSIEAALWVSFAGLIALQAVAFLPLLRKGGRPAA